MKRRAVVFRPLAREDINRIYDNLAERVSELSAFNYVNRILAFCEKLDIMPERGHLSDELEADMRVITFSATDHGRIHHCGRRGSHLPHLC